MTDKKKLVERIYDEGEHDIRCIANLTALDSAYTAAECESFLEYAVKRQVESLLEGTVGND